MAKQKDPNARIKNRQSDLIQNITNRYRVTAREARDIVTAVGTAGATLKNEQIRGYFLAKPTYGSERKRTQEPVVAAKNIARQVKETGRAALTGKSGTKSDQIKKKSPHRPYSDGSRAGYDKTYEYKKGASRNSRKMVKKPNK